MALQQNLRWQTFQKDWGTGWGIRWDERNATPRFLYAPVTSIRNESALIVAIAELCGVSPEEWYLDAVHNRNDRQTSTWKRKHQGATVIGDSIAFISRAGQIHGVWIQSTPLVDIPGPEPGEQILPLPLGKGPSTASTGVQNFLVTEYADNDEVFYLDRLGQEVYRYSTRHYGTIEMSLEERTVDDPLIVVPARRVTVEDPSGSTSAETNDEGVHSLTDGPSGSAWPVQQSS